MIPDLPLSLFVMAIAGPLLLYAFYPLGWHDLGRFVDYYRFHAQHEHYPVDYFGTMYTGPPFPISYPFVMSAITIPLPILAAGVLGLILCGLGGLSALGAKDEDRDARMILLLCALVPPAIIAIPSVPIFGGTKHWMTMMPFFCLCAAAVVWRAAQAFSSRPTRALVIAAVLAMPLADTVRTQPLGHTYFNELVLGHRGGAALGMPRTFWGGDSRTLLPILNEKASRGASVFTHRMNLDSFRAYQRDALIRGDLRFVQDLRRADWALVNHQREYQDTEYEVWSIIGHRVPIAMCVFDEVPIVSLYEIRR